MPQWVGIRTTQPLITQISRFDRWKDPLGVVAAYRLAREEEPGLQLALVGSMAFDDPEGWDMYREIREVALDPEIHVFTNLTGVGNIEVNAFQRLSDVVIQKSVREGFGLVVSEALWKGTPVVAGRAGDSAAGWRTTRAACWSTAWKNVRAPWSRCCGTRTGRERSVPVGANGCGGTS